MAETALTTALADALSGTTDSDSDAVYNTIGESTYYTTDLRLTEMLLRMVKPAGNSGRVYQDGDLTYGVRALDFLDGDTLREYAGSTENELENNKTTRIWLTAAAAIGTSTSAFPDPSTTPHIPLATIVTSGGTYDYTGITDNRNRSLYQILNELTSAEANALGVGVKFSMAVPGTWTIDSDAKNGGLAGLDQALDLTATEAAAAYCKVYDASDDSGSGAFYNLSASSDGPGYTANYQLYPDTEAENDAAYFGNSVAFCQIWMDMATNAVYNADDSLIWEYYNGSSWATLMTAISYDHTDTDDNDGGRSFQQDGAIAFAPPSNWAAVTVDSQSAYWVRARCTASVDITTIPKTNSKEHYVCTPADGFTVPCDCTITDIRLVDQATTPHTAADVKFVVMNFTKGTYTAEQTFPQDKRQDVYTSLTLDCDAGDELGVLVTQDDGTNEVTNAILEFIATLG